MSDRNQAPEPLRSSGIAGALIIGALLLFFLFEASFFFGPRPNAPGPVQVQSVVAAERTQSTVAADGTVDWLPAMTVTAPIAGRVTKVNFHAGDHVRGGQDLFVLTPVAATISHDKRRLARDEANHRKLLARDAPQTLSGPGQGNGNTVEAAEARLEADRFDLHGVSVVAPADGVASDPLVLPGDTVHAGWHLVNINPSRQRVSFSVPNSIADLLRPGTIISVANDAGVHMLAQVKTTGDDDTGSVVPVTATLLSKQPGLLPGTAVRVSITIPGGRKFVALPAQSIAARSAGPSVYVIASDGSIEVRPVDVASIQDGTALIDRGLAPGERVVKNGHLQLAAGTRVKIDNPPQT